MIGLLLSLIAGMAAALLAILVYRWVCRVCRIVRRAAQRMTARQRLAYQARLVWRRRDRDRRRAEVPIASTPGPAELGMPDPDEGTRAAIASEERAALLDELHIRRN